MQPHRGWKGFCLCMSITMSQCCASYARWGGLHFVQASVFKLGLYQNKEINLLSWTESKVLGYVLVQHRTKTMNFCFLIFFFWRVKSWSDCSLDLKETISTANPVLHMHRLICWHQAWFYTLRSNSVYKVPPASPSALPRFLQVLLHCLLFIPYIFFPAVSHGIDLIFQIIPFSRYLQPGTQHVKYLSQILAFRSLHSYVLAYISDCILFKLVNVNQSLPGSLQAGI